MARVIDHVYGGVEMELLGNRSRQIWGSIVATKLWLNLYMANFVKNCLYLKKAVIHPSNEIRYIH